MAGETLAKRCAQAIFQIGHEAGSLDQWTRDLRMISQALEHEEFRVLLQHSRLSLSQRVRIIREVLPDAQPHAHNLLGLLASRGLVELAPGVEAKYLRLLDVHLGRERVEVLSAVELETNEREQVSRFLADMVQKEIVLNTRVDPMVLGGLVVRVGDKLIDGSTRNRLEQLKKRLMTDSLRSEG